MIYCTYVRAYEHSRKYFFFEREMTLLYLYGTVPYSKVHGIFSLWWIYLYVIDKMKESSSLPITVATSLIGATIVAGIFFSYNRHIGTQSKEVDCKKEENNDNKVVSHELSFTDTYMYNTNVPVICTLTWFKGDFRDAKVQLEKQMTSLMEKNPWLLSRIVKDKKCPFNYRMSYSTPKDYKDILHEYLMALEPQESPITRECPFDKIGTKIYKSHPDLFLSNSTKVPIFRVTILPCSQNPHQNFGVMVQLSHTVSDGATYYQILHMLLTKDSSNIIPLNAQRIFNSEEIQQTLLGKAEYDAMKSIGSTVRIIRGVISSLMSRQPFCFRFGWVDPLKIKQVKEIALQNQNEETGTKVQFVSTNDVITSWFMNQSKCDYGYMAINWRGRIEGHSMLNAGNYENVIYYQKEDFNCPTLIRRSINGREQKTTTTNGDQSRIMYKRAVTHNSKVPGLMEGFTTKCGVVTNWSSFAQPNEIEGCEEDLHLPVSFLEIFPTTIALLIIFRGGPGKIGVCYGHASGPNLLDDCPFLMKE